MTDVVKFVILCLIGLALIVGLGYGGFKLQRWWHWEFSYKDQVTQTVMELVRPECLNPLNK